ncbi:MAG: DUF2203 domain-containing protein [Bryobacteraceae bacterium]|jgi:hypothetical protein
MPRFFTLQQAETILPDVETAIREAISLKTEYERTQSDWQSLAQRVAVMGGMRMDRAHVVEQKNCREEAGHALQQAVERVLEFGCLVKDLDIGLIDFPTLFQGEEVYLCWKLGERGIRFWHGVTEGFRGRKPIDSGFLERHRGELPN